MKHLNQTFKQVLLSALLIAIAFQSCTKDEEQSDNPITPQTHEQGEIINSLSLGTFTPDDIQQIYNAANIPIPFELNYSVDVLSVNYYTVDKDGNIIRVSGAFCIPQGVDNLPLMSLQHGTETKANLVASVSPNNSTEGMVGLLFASIGYFTIIPDYIGLGTSQLAHPYLHIESLVPCIIDFMTASSLYCSVNQITLSKKLFLTGYSEGGFLSLAAQKTIEEDLTFEFDIVAVSPASGPYDLKGMIDSIFVVDDYISPAYAAYFFKAYDEIYNWNRLVDIFSPSYVSIIPGLFDGSKTWGQIINQLPESFSEIMNPAFISDYKNGNEPDIIAAIQENTLLNWKPIAPIHFFHGDADQIVPYQNVLTAIEIFNSNGAESIELTTIPGGTHETSGPAAIFGAIEWFESLPTN